MSDNNDLRKNGSGCWDLTAYEAIKNLEGDDDYERACAFIDAVKALAKESDFKIINRIRFKDKRTGRIYK